jgi:hypothetical protein
MKFCPKLFSASGIFCAMVLLHACVQKNNNDSVSAIKDLIRTPVGNAYAGIDQSPMDISYFPTDFPQEKMTTAEHTVPPVARIIYSRPHKKNRIIFSDNEKSLCPYGKFWRLGANEATEIEFFQPVVINEKNIPAGRYIMYCIPFADKWVVALNKDLYSWGLKIDTTKDLIRTEVPVQKQNPVIEDFTIVFQPASYGADLLMAWDDVKTLLPITFSK